MKSPLINLEQIRTTYIFKNRSVSLYRFSYSISTPFVQHAEFFFFCFLYLQGFVSNEEADPFESWVFFVYLQVWVLCISSRVSTILSQRSGVTSCVTIAYRCGSTSEHAWDDICISLVVFV